ncbi:MAG: type II toxin-antitoxin system VapC family toxin, partial [Bryobacteraceae bacterium]
FHRKLREGLLTTQSARSIRRFFLEDIENQVWYLTPVTERILRQVERMTASLPKNVPLRGGDAIHIAAAQEGGFTELWTNDRHLLAASEHFGIRGRSV